MRVFWTAVGCGAFCAAVANAAPTAADLAGALGLAPDAGGQVRNMCDSTVTLEIHNVALGGAVGTGYLVVIPGGDATPACYGDAPGDMYLLVADGAGYRQVFAGAGYVTILPSQTAGVSDFTLAGPGFSFPVYRWNGTSFAVGGEISDSDLAAFGTLATYP